MIAFHAGHREIMQRANENGERSDDPNGPGDQICVNHMAVDHIGAEVANHFCQPEQAADRASPSHIQVHQFDSTGGKVRRAGCPAATWRPRASSIRGSERRVRGHDLLFGPAPHAHGGAEEQEPFLAGSARYRCSNH